MVCFGMDLIVRMMNYTIANVLSMIMTDNKITGFKHKA